MRYPKRGHAQDDKRLYWNACTKEECGASPVCSYESSGAKALEAAVVAGADLMFALLPPVPEQRTRDGEIVADDRPESDLAIVCVVREAPVTPDRLRSATNVLTIGLNCTAATASRSTTVMCSRWLLGGKQSAAALSWTGAILAEFQF